MITKLKKNQVFVFGSNLKGIHGKGAALDAYKKFGATWGRCHGLDGNTYGIPTKDENFQPLSIERIRKYVDNFIEDATNYPEMEFLVTEIGCGLAGYTPRDIAPLFEKAKNIKNIILPENFK